MRVSAFIKRTLYISKEMDVLVASVSTTPTGTRLYTISYMAELSSSAHSSSRIANNHWCL